MSMPMLAVSSTMDESPPTMRLADDAAPVDASAAFDVRPGQTPDVPATPRVYAHSGMLFADDGATLPAACVVCGDNLGLFTLPTLRGRVRFALCNEHLVTGAARAVVGFGICGVAAYLFVVGSGSTTSKLAISLFLSAIGATLIASSVPVWTWRRRGEPRRLMRVGSAVRASVERASR